MNKKVIIVSLKDNQGIIFISICFLIGTVVSLYLSMTISTYFYFLTGPFFLLTFLLGKLTFIQIRDRYKKLIKEEKYFNDGRHVEYYSKKKKQIKFELHIINGKRHGAFIEYYSNNQIRKDFNYNNGVQEGKGSSFYDNGNKYREVNFINDEYEGVVKEYFRNGNLKFVLNDNKYTFYDEAKNIRCEVEIERALQPSRKNIPGKFWSSGHPQYYSLFKGLWKNYREDGTIEFELDFEDLNSINGDFGSNGGGNIVMKTVFTKKGAFFSKNPVVYYGKDSGVYERNFFNKYAEGRMMENATYTAGGIKGPPGMGGATVYVLKPITSIEDIIEFK
jgi:antitoxin component YwqK of YwqJK toxin-antitoxin module